MKICIAHPNEAAYSETFIRAHIERLPGEKLVLTDGNFPSIGGNRRIVPRRWRIARLFRSRLPGALRGLAEKAPARWLARLLKAEWVDVVLAEYGLTGAEIWESCRDAG
jgi:colanic acid/amylovoran biosynthesis glycosyltransferase